MIDFKFVQPEKQLLPKLATDDGMEIEVKPEQLIKKLSPKLVTDDGMVTEVKFSQPEKQ